MTNRVVGNQTIKPITRGCREHKAITEFQSKNQQRNQKQYFALELSLSPTRKSLHALLTELVPFTLSLAERNVDTSKEILNYDVYSDAHNILKEREFKTNIQDLRFCFADF